MAIITNGLLGSSRNKVGSIVTYRMKGQDIARSKAAQVSNPRTAAQQTQRVKMANVVNMYKVNRPWMERLAFESKLTSWSVYNAFVSANLTNNRVYLTKQQADRGDTIVAPYKMTEGSIPSIIHSADTTDPNTYATDLYIGTINPAEATVAEITRALIDNNNGISVGMQLSLVVNYQGQNQGQYTAVARYYECILSLDDDTPFTQRIAESHVANVGNALGFTYGDGEPVLGFTYILSQDVGSKTRVSTQYLIIPDDTLYQSFGEDAALQNARLSYGSTTAPFLAGGYQGGSNDEVAIQPSILSAAIDNGNPVNVNYTLGTRGGENEFTITLALSSLAGGTPVRMTIYGGGETAATEDIAGSATSIVGTFPANTNFNPSTYIDRIDLTLSNGTTISGYWRVPSGDVTE